MARRGCLSHVVGALGMVASAVLTPGCVRGEVRQRMVAIDVSPDGKHIAFTGGVDTEQGLYLFDATARTVALVAHHDGISEPRFARGGTALVCSAPSASGAGCNLVVYPTSGGLRRQLTQGDKVWDAGAATARHSDVVVFARSVGTRPYSMGGTVRSDWDLWAINLDGTGLRALTSEHALGGFDGQALTPDGATVLVASGDSMEQMSVAEPRRRHDLKLGAELVYQPSYSPDGTLIAYVGIVTPTEDDDREGRPFVYAIWVVSSAGQGKRRITQTNSSDFGPVWSPDGKRIYFLSDPGRNHRYDLWEIGVDGKGLKMIADSSLFDHPMQWRPK